MFYMLTTDGYVTIKTELNILSKNFTTCKLYLNKQEHKKNHAQWNHLIWSETSKSSINSRFLCCILLVFFVNYHCQCVVIIEFLMQLDVKSEICFHISSVQSLSRVQLFVTPWITAHQASLSTTNSWNLLKLMPIESLMPSSHLILCCPLLLLPSSPPGVGGRRIRSQKLVS